MSERAGVPAKHWATRPIWAWLESRTIQELPAEKRDRIAAKLMDLDAELWTWDAASEPRRVAGCKGLSRGVVSVPASAEDSCPAGDLKVGAASNREATQ